MNKSDAVQPFLHQDNAAFDEAWQAQVLAIADSLIQRGNFSANQWADALGAKRRAAQISGQPDTVETYYHCALAALETLLSAASMLDRQTIEDRHQTWARAYLATPHGQPVLLTAAQNRPK